MSNDPADLIGCPACGYSITREICRARRLRTEGDLPPPGRCRRCPENTGQLFLFGSPRQMDAADGPGFLGQRRRNAG